MIERHQNRNDLRDFFLRLAQFEERRPQMVAKWPADEVTRITRAFQSAFRACRLARRWFPVPPRISAPALGNRVAAQFADCMNPRLRGLVLQDLPGAGYPDRALLRLPSLDLCAVVEIKAKRAWSRDNWHRQVLTSCSRKLQLYFPKIPLCHLLMTVLYVKRHNAIRMKSIRLDFLEPNSPVETRLEASVSQHLLAKGKHPVRVVRGAPRTKASKGGTAPMRSRQKSRRPSRTKRIKRR